jgi:hypothetical protein
MVFEGWIFFKEQYLKNIGHPGLAVKQKSQTYDADREAFWISC